MKTLLAFAALGFTQFLVFFPDLRHFFIGDGIIWIARRHRSVMEFLEAFVQVDQGGWYRPLTQRVIPSVLFPLVGLQPVAYHLVGYALFLSCTAAVFFLVNQLTQSRRTAWFALLFFAFHGTHAFVTYDVAFTPELLLFLFYAGSAAAYVAYIRSAKLRMRWLSIALMACGLLSKETAVAMPFTLCFLWLLVPRSTRIPLRSLASHFLLLAFYLVFAFGFLHVRDIRAAELLESPGEVGGQGYTLSAGKNVAENFGLAVSWALGIPRGPQSGDPPLGQRSLWVLRAFGLVIAAGVLLFFTKSRFLLLGIAWFVSSMAPTLPLVDHFIPYYLFVPLIGFSLAVGVILDQMYERLTNISKPLASAPVLLLILFAIVQARIGTEVRTSHSILGKSAQNASNSLNDLKNLHPTLPEAATILVLNAQEPPIDWDQGYGQVFQLGFDDPSLVTLYSIDGKSVTQEQLRSGSTFVMQWSDGHLIERTSAAIQRPDVFLRPSPMFEAMELSATEVEIGDSYHVTLSSLPGAAIDVVYMLQGTMMPEFKVNLDEQGSVAFTTSSQTARGRYTFLAIKQLREKDWSLVDRSIIVH